jgi:hypothetical protein
MKSTPANPIKQEPASPRVWPVWSRVVVSVVLLLHAAAILSGVFATPPASELERNLAEFFLPYNELIDQGYSYRYFAPEPPPTPILIAKLYDKQGRELRSVRIPERGVTPRQRYQRQLAVANAIASSVEQTRQDPRHSLPFWSTAFGKHLGRLDPSCARVRLFLEYHLIPNLQEIGSQLASEGRSPDLDDPRFYSVPELIGDIECDSSTP